jgi:hypothetical protein
LLSNRADRTYSGSTEHSYSSGKVPSEARQNAQPLMTTVSYFMYPRQRGDLMCTRRSSGGAWSGPGPGSGGCRISTRRSSTAKPRGAATTGLYSETATEVGEAGESKWSPGESSKKSGKHRVVADSGCDLGLVFEQVSSTSCSLLRRRFYKTSCSLLRRRFYKRQLECIEIGK